MQRLILALVLCLAPTMVSAESYFKPGTIFRATDKFKAFVVNEDGFQGHRFFKSGEECFVNYRDSLVLIHASYRSATATQRMYNSPESDSCPNGAMLGFETSHIDRLSFSADEEFTRPIVGNGGPK